MPEEPDDIDLLLPGAEAGERRSGWERRHDVSARIKNDRRRRTDRRRPGGLQRRRRRLQRLRRSMILLVALAVVAGGGYVGYRALRPVVDSFTASNDYPGPGSGVVEVAIAPGASGAAIGRVLAAADVVKSEGAFVAAAKKNPKAPTIAPGTYAMRKQMSAAAAVTRLLDPAARKSERVTVREGLRVTEIVALLSKSTGQPVAAYTAALKKPAALGVPAIAKGKVEGWLFPASYEFDAKSTARQQLSAMVAQTKKVLASVGVRSNDTQRILTVASIAEVEAASADDYAKVARTIDNRLADGMKLQLDSTVSYAVGRRSITTTAAERATRSPYNTYYVTGLPAGPISNPGRAAIEGAVKPTAGPWLYFVTVDPGTGETRFATTAAQHARNVALFQTWCRAHAGQC